MKPFILLSLIVIVGISATSCKKSKIDTGNVTVDSMQLQYGGGFGPEAIWNYYMIANGEAKEDTTTPFSNKSPNQFDYTLSQDKYNKVKHLLNEVPAQLLKESGSNYNNSTIVDGGTTTVIAYKNGTTYTWSFYEATQGMDDYVKTFADKVHSGVNELRAQ